MEIINFQNSKLRSGTNWTYESENICEWKFPWLLSNFTSNTWDIDSGEGKFVRIDFDVYIPTTAETLNQKKYSLIINTIKKILALHRTGHLAELNGNDSLTTRANSMRSNANSLKLLALFLIKEYGEKCVIENGFNLLTKKDLEKFHFDVATGRAGKATGLTDIIYHKISMLDNDDIISLFQIKNRKENNDIGINEFLNKLGIKSNKLSLFTRNITNEMLVNLFPTLNIRIISRTSKNRSEFKNACPPKFYKSDKKIGETTFEQLTIAPKLLNRFSLYLPELSGYSNPVLYTSEKFNNENIKPKERTPDIPTETALYYLNESIKFVACYGKHIAETKKQCELNLMRIQKKSMKYRRDYILSDRFQEKISIPVNKFTKDFNITRYHELPTKATHNELRQNLTVLFAYKMLIAATYILINTFCIKRVSEILNLKESNIENGLWGGYEIFFGIRKSTPTESSTLVTGRPIPRLVFESIYYLSDANSHYYSENEDLYIFPKQYNASSIGELPKNQSMSQTAIVNALIAFGDFIQVPLEINNGIKSRFYLTRTHVLRRFGARAFFSLSNLSDFPALTWLMGHASTEETWHYLLKEIDNECLTEEEAIAVIDVIQEPKINTTIIENEINENFNMRFNNLSKFMISDYIKDRIRNGAKIIKYVDDLGKLSIWMETRHDEK